MKRDVKRRRKKKNDDNIRVAIEFVKRVEKKMDEITKQTNIHQDQLYKYSVQVIQMIGRLRKEKRRRERIEKDLESIGKRQREVIDSLTHRLMKYQSNERHENQTIQKTKRTLLLNYEKRLHYLTETFEELSYLDEIQKEKLHEQRRIISKMERMRKNSSFSSSSSNYHHHSNNNTRRRMMFVDGAKDFDEEEEKEKDRKHISGLHFNSLIKKYFNFVEENREKVDPLNSIYNEENDDDGHDQHQNDGGTLASAAVIEKKKNQKRKETIEVRSIGIQVKPSFL